METVSFLKKVKRMRDLDKRYWYLKSIKSSDAVNVLKELKSIQTQVDDELPTQIVKCETPKLF
jgi:hypothetical protein